MGFVLCVGKGTSILSYYKRMSYLCVKVLNVNDMIQKETLIVRNFGPVREAIIEDVKQFMFFIGESGSGKSTLLKILALMRHICKQLNLRSYLKLGNVIDKTIDVGMGEYLRNGGMSDYLSEQTELYYKKGDCELSYTAKGLKGTRKIISAASLSLEKYPSCRTSVEPSPLCSPTIVTVRLSDFI